MDFKVATTLETFAEESSEKKWRKTIGASQPKERFPICNRSLVN